MTELTDFFVVRYGWLTFSCYVVPKCSLALRIGFVDMRPAENPLLSGVSKSQSNFVAGQSLSLKKKTLVKNTM